MLRVVFHGKVEEHLGALEQIDDRRRRIDHDDIGVDSAASVDGPAAVGAANLLRHLDEVFVLLIV